jgi:hypothetical protein
MLIHYFYIVDSILFNGHLNDAEYIKCLDVSCPHIADQLSSIFWLMHSDLHEPKVLRAFECLSTMVACVEPALVDPAYGETPGNMPFLEQNYSNAKFIVRLKRRNGRVKHLVSLWFTSMSIFYPKFHALKEFGLILGTILICVV